MHNEYMSGSIELTYRNPGTKIEQKVLRHAGSGYRRSHFVKGLILSEKSSVNLNEYTLSTRIGIGTLTGLICGAVIGLLFGSGVMFADDLRPLFFSSELFSVLGFKQSSSITMAGSVTGMLLGSVIGLLSLFEAIE